MKQIDVIKIKQAVKEGQLKFFVLEQYDGQYIYCKDEVGETVIVGKVEEKYLVPTGNVDVFDIGDPYQSVDITMWQQYEKLLPYLNFPHE